MKNFSLDASMTAAIGGAFTPRVIPLVMFPDPDDGKARGWASQLADKWIQCRRDLPDSA